MRRAGGRPYFPGLLEGHYARAGQNLARLARLGYVAKESGRFTLFSSAFAEWIVSRCGPVARLRAERRTQPWKRC